MTEVWIDGVCCAFEVVTAPTIGIPIGVSEEESAQNFREHVEEQLMETEEDAIKRFVEELFTDGGDGEKADRLVLLQDDPPRALSGWCRKAIIDRLRVFLREQQQKRDE